MSSRILAGRYELLEKIGDGGMAVVYKARCRLLNRYVAIKILKPEFAKDVKFIENFRRESQSAAALSHPNIVNIYDVGREGNIHYIVMEIIEGNILSDMIKEKGTIEWRRAVEITKQIAAALSFAHKNHIIHRDVKPHNILITEDGTAKITDFGIAKAINSAAAAENTGTIMGSVHYFSPEQARGGYVDEKSDIYSLGIVLYEMLTGKVPFDGDNPVAVALMHINNEMTPPSEVNPAIPKSLEQVVMKATDKFQINRYSSADEMLKALEDVEFTEMLGKKPAFTPDTIALSSSIEGDAQLSEEDIASGEDMKDANKSKKKRKWNRARTFAVIAALIVALPLSYAIVSGISSLISGEGKEFELPDFRGLTFEEAEELAAGYEINLKKGDSVYNADYDDGEISSQSPDVGSSVKAGNTVTVNISKGMKAGTVPKIEGMTFESALHILDKYDFKRGTVTTQPSSQPKDIVLSQSPAAGEEATPGSYVSFVVSEGTSEEEAIVPLVVGMDIDEAKSALENAGLKPGAVDYEESQAYPVNQVTWQQYAADTTAVKGSTVDLKVSGEEESEDIPAGISLYIDYAAAEDSVFWLTVTVSDESGPHNIITREQRLKDDVGENIFLTGTGTGTVTVIFNNDTVLKKNVDFNTGVMD